MRMQDLDRNRRGGYRRWGLLRQGGGKDRHAFAALRRQVRWGDKVLLQSRPVYLEQNHRMSTKASITNTSTYLSYGTSPNRTLPKLLKDLLERSLKDILDDLPGM